MARVCGARQGGTDCNATLERKCGVREAEAGAPAITQLSTVMVPTCGSDGARQSRVQQPQQLGAPTVDATPNADVEGAPHDRSEQTTHTSVSTGT